MREFLRNGGNPNSLSSNVRPFSALEFLPEVTDSGLSESESKDLLRRMTYLKNLELKRMGT